ncbi:MAG: hypothetical protein K6E76_02575 [Patescibacteria group bacterium]|nr:hypothetical protein [Patescibacteria group bacterium]
MKNGITTCDDPEQCDPNAPESTWDPHTSNQFCNQNCKLETKTQPKPTCKTVTTEYNGENFPKDKIKQLC